MSEPPHVAVHAVARAVEFLARRLHDLAFDIGEAGVTPHVQAKADAIGDELLAAVHCDRSRLMPTRPPTFRPRSASAPKARTWTTSERKTRQERGYGRAHDLMRERVLREEPLCRACAIAGRVAATMIADHIVPIAEGGSGERDNYQGLCIPCHRAKTAAEAARARRG